jgi:hypothetical protein
MPGVAVSKWASGGREPAGHARLTADAQPLSGLPLDGHSGGREKLGWRRIARMC